MLLPLFHLIVIVIDVLQQASSGAIKVNHEFTLDEHRMAGPKDWLDHYRKIPHSLSVTRPQPKNYFSVLSSRILTLHSTGINRRVELEVHFYPMPLVFIVD